MNAHQLAQLAMNRAKMYSAALEAHLREGVQLHEAREEASKFATAFALCELYQSGEHGDKCPLCSGDV